MARSPHIPVNRLPTWTASAAIVVGSLLLATGAALLPAALRVGMLAALLVLVAAGWSWERMRSQQRLLALASQIGQGKLEVGNDPVLAQLQQAINGVVQQRRVDCQRGTGQSATVSVLTVAARKHAATSEAVVALAGQVAALAERNGADVQVQGGGSFALIFGLDAALPLVTSSAHALQAARRLAQLNSQLRFGLACGQSVQLNSALGPLITGAALDDAQRLVQMADGWPEYNILCPEPLALLLQQGNQLARTPLELSGPRTSTVRVYSLDLLAQPAVHVFNEV